MIGELLPFSFDQTDELVALWRASFERAIGIVDPHPIAEQRTYLLSKVVPRNRVIVAPEATRIVGFIAASRERIDQFYVHVDRQRQGIGSALLQWAKDQSAGTLRLHTFERNQQARQFYEARGFRIVGRGFETEWQLPDIEYQWTAADSQTASP